MFYNHIFIMAVPLFFGLLRAATPTTGPELSSTGVAAQSTATYSDNMSSLSTSPTSEAPATTTTSDPVSHEYDSTASAGTLSTAPTSSISTPTTGPELSSTGVAAQSTATYSDNMSSLSTSPTSEAPATTTTSDPVSHENDSTTSAGTLSTAPTSSIWAELSSTDEAMRSTESNFDNMSSISISSTSEVPDTTTTDDPSHPATASASGLSTASTQSIHCDALANPTDGSVIAPNGTEFGDIATYSCNTGYTLNGVETVTCQANATWTHTAPTCDIVDCHAPENISNGIVKFAMGTEYGSEAQYICESGFEFSTSLVNQTVFCNASGEWEPSVNNCTDIDECARHLDDCDFRANCSDTEGSFSCKCRQGFEDKHFMSQGKECVDIDECAYPHPCYANGTRRCINVIGQYFCACNQGYTGKRCEKETDECENSGSCGVNAICTNTPGSYYCHCNDTYPSGNPYIHCYENTIIHFEPDVDPIRGNTVKMTSHAVPFRYTYFGVQHYVFRAAMDGFISLGFQQVFDRYAPADPSEWVKSSHFNSAYDPAAIIAPLWSDLDTTNITNAGLFVHYFSADETGNITDSNTQNAFESAMHAFGSYVNDSIFEPKVLIEATWANVTVAFQPLPPQKFVKRENATMQAILISDGISTYIMFNYAQDEWNIKPGHRRFGVAGYSYANFTGNVIADDVTFVNLSTTSTNSDLNGRHIFNVTQGDPAQMAFLQTEEDCRSFYNNQSVWACISEKNKKAYICPCQEDFVKYDLSLHKVDIKETLGHGVDYPDKTACYQEWFFNFGGVKQTCCYQFHSISTSQYAGGVAMFENDECGADVGYKKCCVQSKRLCHLFYKMNPPNDCTGYEFPSFIG